jgi:RNA polymerase sigma factor (sigma-70 family)
MGQPQFQTTSWSLVLDAASNSSEAREALEALCQIYWKPVYAFIRRKGHDPDKAQDLTQEYFARLIEKNYLEHADRTRGRFRSFLLVSVRNFLANQWDRERARKRGGDRRPVSIDGLEAEQWYALAIANDDTPEALFERRWAVSLIERVMLRLRATYADAGKEQLFLSLEGFLQRESSDGYEQLAKEMNVSAGSLRMSVLRMRRRYRALLRAEIAQTVDKTEEIDEEIRFLQSSLSR